MASSRVSLLALALCSVVSPSASWAAGGTQAGVSAAVRGEVALAEAAAAGLVGRTIGDGEAVYLGNKLSSGTRSGMQLMLLDQTTVTLGEQAELVVNEFVYDPGRGSGRLALDVTKGVFRVVTGGVSDIEPTNTQILVPTATIGVRGTIVLSKVTSKGALIVLGGPGVDTDTRERHGAIDVSNPYGQVTVTRPGWGTFVAPGQAPEEPRPVSEEEMSDLLNGFVQTVDLDQAGRERNTPGSRLEPGDARWASETSGESRAAGGVALNGMRPVTAALMKGNEESDENTRQTLYGPNGELLPSTSTTPNQPPITAALGPTTVADAALVAPFVATRSFSQSGLPLYGNGGSFSNSGPVFGSFDMSLNVNFVTQSVTLQYTNIVIPEGTLPNTPLTTYSWASLAPTSIIIFSSNGSATIGAQGFSYGGTAVLVNGPTTSDVARQANTAFLINQIGIAPDYDFTGTFTAP
jgi:hypothetical protein